MRTRTKNKKKEIEVFQSQGDFFWRALHYKGQMSIDEIRAEFLKRENYKSVGFMERTIDDIHQQLQHVFYVTNHVEGPWKGGSRSCRSTSVGDIVRIGTEYWIVAPIGWDPMPME